MAHTLAAGTIYISQSQFLRPSVSLHLCSGQRRADDTIWQDLERLHREGVCGVSLEGEAVTPMPPTGAAERGGDSWELPEASVPRHWEPQCGFSKCETTPALCFEKITLTALRRMASEMEELGLERG